MNKKSNRRSGFTLVEVLIVVVIMAILAATIVPQFSNSSNDAKVSSAQFNLNTLRAQIELYKSQHNGTLPTQQLVELTSTTNNTGTVGTGTAFTYGPYIQAIPMNSVTNSNTVVAGPANGASRRPSFQAAGWQYDTGTGKLFFNDNTLVPFANQ